MYLIFKRFLDVVYSLFLLIFAALPMIIIAILIKLEDGGKVFFVQKRIGKNCKTFYIYKFRTMKTQREALNSKLTHEQMVTKVGRVLRKTSFDELPQLFNILKGDMSFIGPRPWIEEYYVWFTDEQKRRSDVLPGISGLAQARGRNGISIFKKIQHDLYYVDNISFCLDAKIIWWTIKTVIKREDSEISECGIKDELEQLKRKKKKEIMVKEKEIKEKVCV